MKIQVEIGGKMYGCALPGHSIAIPIQFDGPQPNTYGVPAATSKAYEGSGFIGDTRQGSGCNFETYNFTPHCNGTHTECIGHIALDRIAITDQLRDTLLPSKLISINPVSAKDSADNYSPNLNPEDQVIDRQSLENALQHADEHFLQALVIRTLPNSTDKKSRDYMQMAPAFFTLEAMQYLAARDIDHLLIDLPSVDRLFDEGQLSTHHIFWNVAQGTHDVTEDTASHKTITEMIFVPDEIPDGDYLLNLQIAAFVSDCAPSRPILYPLHEIES